MLQVWCIVSASIFFHDTDYTIYSTPDQCKPPGVYSYTDTGVGEDSGKKLRFTLESYAFQHTCCANFLLSSDVF